MPTIPIKRIQRINKTVPDVDINGIVFTQSKDKLTITVNNEIYPDFEDREGLIQKVIDFANNPLFIVKIIDIFNTDEDPSNLIWKNEITVDDIPQSEKMKYYNQMTKDDVPAHIKAQIIADSKV